MLLNLKLLQFRQRPSKRSHPTLSSSHSMQSMIYTLPHNSNLRLWRKKLSSCCQNDNQSLIHVLNNCEVALHLHRYNECHDQVLAIISSTVTDYLPPTTTSTVDLGTGYSFPHHIAPTDLRPDIVLWDDSNKSLTLLELTVCFETSFDDARVRKQDKYRDD